MPQGPPDATAERKALLNAQAAVRSARAGRRLALNKDGSLDRRVMGQRDGTDDQLRSTYAAKRLKTKGAGR